MTNMSYCQFQNTLSDMRDLDRHKELEKGGREAEARLSLLQECVDIARDYGEYLDEDYFNYEEDEEEEEIEEVKEEKKVEAKEEEKKFTVREFLSNTKNISQMTIDANFRDVSLFDWFEDDELHNRLFRRALRQIREIIQRCTNFAILDKEFLMKINSSDTISVWIGKMYIEMETDLESYADDNWNYEFQKDIDDDKSRENRQETRDEDRLIKFINS